MVGCDVQSGTHKTEGQTERLLGNVVYLLQVEHQTLQHDIERLPPPLPPRSWRRTSKNVTRHVLTSDFQTSLTEQIEVENGAMRNSKTHVRHKPAVVEIKSTLSFHSINLEQGFNLITLI